MNSTNSIKLMLISKPMNHFTILKEMDFMITATTNNLWEMMLVIWVNSKTKEICSESVESEASQNHNKFQT